MAVKIVRQPNKIALIGASSSTAGFAAGTEKAPAALRAAGLIEKLRSVGYEVTDFGDCEPRLFADGAGDQHGRRGAETAGDRRDRRRDQQHAHDAFGAAGAV